MKVIGLTGNIGSGKSSVARMLEEMGAAHIDADKVTHEVYRPGTPGWEKMVETFGKDILGAGGTIDRKKLSGIVFNNPETVAKLNRILHPLIRKEVEERLGRLRAQGEKAAVVEATLLVEAGWRDMVDELWLVTAPREITLRRLKERGLSETEALARMAAQTPPDKLARLATAVIENNGSLSDLKLKVRALWNRLVEETGQVEITQPSGE